MPCWVIMCHWTETKISINTFFMILIKTINNNKNLFFFPPLTNLIIHASEKESLVLLYSEPTAISLYFISISHIAQWSSAPDYRAVQIRPNRRRSWCIKYSAHLLMNDTAFLLTTFCICLSHDHFLSMTSRSVTCVLTVLFILWFSNVKNDLCRLQYKLF